MNVKSDLLLPVLTGVLAISLERWIYNRSATYRELVGADPAR